MPDKIRMTAVLHPFKSEKKRLEFKEGVSVQEMLVQAQPDAVKLRNAVVFNHGRIIPRQSWASYFPKHGDLIEARACAVPMGGGGGGGGKDVTRIVLTIAVVALAMATGGAALGLLGFSQATIAAGGAWVTFASAMYIGTVTTIGMLAINALCPTKSPEIASLSSIAGTSESPSLYIEGASNTLNPFSPVPVLFGKYRQTPPLGAKPYTEMIGGDQYFRMLFVWGIGPISIDEASIKIGDTLLTEFSDYQIEHREGYSTDEALTLFPSAISQEDFTVALKSSSSWITRTTTVNADEISIDIAFSSGLVQYDTSGNKQSMSVNVEIEYRKTDSGAAWSKIDTSSANFKTNCDNSWLNTSSSLLQSITFTAKRAAALRYGIRWGVSERAQYDVRIRRVTSDTDSSTIADATYWTAIRSISSESPVNSPVPLAMTALVIKATDQLNGIINDFSGEVTRVCDDWDVDTGTWVERVSQNPASLFRFALQGNGLNTPLADERIDIEALQDWHEFCALKGFKFNMIRDYSSSVWDLLRDICAAGRAAPTMTDGKWSVVIDREQTAPVSVITPRNCYEFSSDKFFLEPPHGWRIQFPNENQSYSADERRVYRDGYDDNNATKFESLELLGVTDPDQIYKLGRWRIAQVLNQPERWTFKQDMEYLTYRRGDWIKIAHDVLIVGLAQGRVKGVTLGDDNAITSIEVDEEVIMEAGKTYGVILRTLENASLSAQVETVEGTTKTLTFTDPVAGIGSPAEQAITIGDIFCFGEFGEETEDATVISIAPNGTLNATIVAIPYRPAIYNVDTEEIPEFVTKITTADVIPAPAVQSIVSDESVMVISSTGTLKIRVGIVFTPLNKSIFGTGNELIVQMRQNGTGEAFYPAVIDDVGDGYVYINEIRTGEIIDVRLRFKVSGKLLPGPWTTITGYTVVGRSTTPSPLANMTISAFGAQAMIRWDKPSELDVIYGGEVLFRHSPLMADATWGSSVSIGQSARARTLFAVLPLKAGTYMARVYDVDGNPSDTITTVTTKQASVHAFASVTTLDEAPSFLGTHSGTGVDDGSLGLVDGASPAVLSGTYYFDSGIDLGSVQRVRLTTRLAVDIFDVGDTIDARVSNIDTWESIDGTINGGADARVFVRHTDENPLTSPVAWSAWERLDSAEFEARAFQFYAVLDRDSVDYNIAISELGIDIDEIA